MAMPTMRPAHMFNTKAFVIIVKILWPRLRNATLISGPQPAQATMVQQMTEQVPIQGAHDSDE